MKTFRTIAKSAALAFSVTALLVMPTALKAQSDSAEINKLLNDAKVEAAELKADSANMESFTRSGASWESYGDHLEMIKEHVNKCGELLMKLQNEKAAGSAWQKVAVDRIEPAVREMADNTTAAIKHLSDNKSKVHMQEFKDYVKANYELASDLEAMIRDFADYGKHKDNVERLKKTLEIGG